MRIFKANFISPSAVTLSKIRVAISGLAIQAATSLRLHFARFGLAFGRTSAALADAEMEDGDHGKRDHECPGEFLARQRA